MRDTELLQAAFGLLPPWMVARSAFDAAAKRLDIHLDFPRGSRLAALTAVRRIALPTTPRR